MAKKPEVPSKKAASLAGKTLRSKTASKEAKSTAAALLKIAPDRKKPAKKGT